MAVEIKHKIQQTQIGFDAITFIYDHSHQLLRLTLKCTSKYTYNEIRYFYYWQIVNKEIENQGLKYRLTAICTVPLVNISLQIYKHQFTKCQQQHTW